MKKPLDPTALRRGKIEALGLDHAVGGEVWDDFVRVAAQLSGTPVAMLNFVAPDRRWTVAKIGDVTLRPDARLPLCEVVVESGDILVIEDATANPISEKLPFVTDAPFVRFYAGVPLRFATGEVVGSLCVLDHRPRALEAAAREGLCALARGVVAYLELRAVVLATNERERRAADLAARDWSDLRSPIEVMGQALAGIRDHGWSLTDRTSVEVARRAFEDLGRRVRAAAPALADARGLSGVDVLVVEDTTIHQRVIRALLEPHGARVHLAASGEDALALCATQTFGLVLMDRFLPGIDGLETIRRMRARETGARTPILGASAISDVDGRDEFIAAGADDVIAKPLVLDEFWAKYYALPTRTRAA